MDSPWSQVFGFAALDHVPVGSCVLNSQLEVVFWNKVLETWTGINRWDILHHEISEFFPHLCQPQYRLRLEEIFQGGPPLVLSSQLHGQIFPSTCQDGQVRLQHTTVTSIPTHDGNGCLACFAVEDVSVVARRIADLRSTRDKAEKLAAEARHANEAKSQFLANMSHELRTPLNSILLLSGMMVEDAKTSLSEADRYSAQIIHSSGDALLELVNDILDLSKVEAGKRDLEIESTDLATFLHDIEDSTALLITHQGLEFKIETGAEVPATFVTDTRALAQITRNLLSNAAKFTREGQVTLNLAVESPDWLDLEDKQGQWLAVSVSDTGPGIAADRQEAIFEPFCQEDGTISREFGGTGLGLSISRQLAEQLGGHLLLDSRLNEGSTFTLFLPSHSSLPETSGAALDYSPRNLAPEIRPKDISGFRNIVDQAVTDWETAESLAPDSLKGYKILVTDDDMRSLFTISGILERGGAEVLSAASGKDAMAKLSNNPDVNLLLIDMTMPEMKVPETLEKIRGLLDRSDVPMICMTGQQEDDGCRGCGHCLAKLTLTKPFPHKELLGQIEQLLSQPITLA